MSPDEWGQHHCPICFKGLDNPRQKYCSKKCKQIAYRRRKRMPKGVMERYKVVDRQTGEEVKGLFVIDPISDPHARAGLMAYARSVGDDNFQLSMDLMHYVTRLDETERRSKPKISGSMELPGWLIELANDEQSDNGAASNSTE